MNDVVIVYSAEQYATSFNKSLDQVAREQKYLAMVEAPSVEATVRFVKSMVEQNAAQYFAMIEDEVVGWCNISPYSRITMKHTGALGMGVIAAHRGKGIGEKLLWKCIEHAWNSGLERIELEVYADNPAAVALYKKLGFQQEGLKAKARKFNGEYKDTTVMALLRD